MKGIEKQWSCSGEPVKMPRAIRDGRLEIALNRSGRRAKSDVCVGRLFRYEVMAVDREINSPEYIMMLWLINVLHVRLHSRDIISYFMPLFYGCKYSAICHPSLFPYSQPLVTIIHPIFADQMTLKCKCKYEIMNEERKSTLNHSTNSSLSYIFLAGPPRMFNIFLRASASTYFQRSLTAALIARRVASNHSSKLLVDGCLL